MTTKKRFELGITIFYLLIKVPHSYSSGDTIPKSNHFFGNTVFGLTWHSNIGTRLVTSYCVCSCKINIFRRVIHNFCCASLCGGLSQPVSPRLLLIWSFHSCRCCFFNMIILPWNSIPCNFSNSFCTCSFCTLLQSQTLYFSHFSQSASQHDNFPVSMWLH